MIIDEVDNVRSGVDCDLIQVNPLVKAWLVQRERDGLDHRDEIWNGVLHLNPPANGRHQRVSGELFPGLFSLAEARGLLLSYETGLFAAADDYKVPDLVAASERYLSVRGVEAPKMWLPEEPLMLVIEIQSPEDDTMEKLQWYERMGIA